jgi:hypothetical protein
MTTLSTGKDLTPTQGATTAPSVTPSRDAIERAIRTFLCNLLVTVLVAVGLAVASGLHDVHWTREWWLALVAKIGADVLAAVAAYVARFLVPPKS